MFRKQKTSYYGHSGSRENLITSVSSHVGLSDATVFSPTDVIRVCLAHQWCPVHRRRMSRPDRRGSTRPQGSSSSHNYSAHHTGSHHTGPDRCHTHRSGMAPASRCPCWCTPVRPLCSLHHHLQQAEVQRHFSHLHSELWPVCDFQTQRLWVRIPVRVHKGALSLSVHGFLVSKDPIKSVFSHISHCQMLQACHSECLLVTKMQ